MARTVVEVLLEPALATLRKSKKFDEQEALRELETRIKNMQQFCAPSQVVCLWLQEQFELLLGYDLQFTLNADEKLVLCRSQILNFDDVGYYSVAWWSWWRLSKRSKQQRALQRLSLLAIVLSEKLIGSDVCCGMAESFETGYEQSSIFEELHEVHVNRHAFQEGEGRGVILTQQKRHGSDCYNRGVYRDLTRQTHFDQQDMHRLRASFSSRKAAGNDYADLPKKETAESWFLLLLKRYRARFSDWQTLVDHARTCFKQLSKLSVGELVTRDANITNLDQFGSFEHYVFTSLAKSLHALDISTPSPYGPGHMPSLQDFDPHFQSQRLHAPTCQEQYCALDFVSLGWSADDFIGRDAINCMNSYYCEEPAEPARLLSMPLADGTLPVMQTDKAALAFIEACGQAAKSIEWGNYLTRKTHGLTTQTIYFNGHTGCSESQYAQEYDFRPWFNNDDLFQWVMRYERDRVFNSERNQRLLQVLAPGNDDEEAEDQLALPDFMRAPS